MSPLLSNALKFLRAHRAPLPLSSTKRCTRECTTWGIAWQAAVEHWPALSSVQRWVDVGAHSWRGIARAADLTPQLQSLVGVELLARRRLRDFRTVAAHAHEQASSLRARGIVIEYLEGDFVERVGRPPLAGEAASLVSFFYPFVRLPTAQAWGLRSSQYRSFSALLGAARLLSPRFVLSVHQGEWEAELAREAYLQVWGETQCTRLQKCVIPAVPVHDAVLWFLPLA